jgi:hypothetical protein
MVSLSSLWLPILAASVLVFVVSAIIHMVLKYHNKDFTRLPNEDGVRAAVRAGSPPPGQYVIPYCSDMKDMEKPEMKQKYIEGPVAVITLMQSAVPNMGTYLVQWFIFILFVSSFIGYVAARAIPAGAEYLHVFRIVAAVGFLTYGAGQVPQAIWWGKPWKSTLKDLIDGLVYGLVTAGTFGWLWPR